MKIFLELLDIILPMRCRVCGTAIIGEEFPMCADCLEKMPLTYFWSIRDNDMSQTINARIELLRSADDVKWYEPFCNACALYFYKAGYRKISKSVKYHADAVCGHKMGEMLGKQLSCCPWLNDVDLIVPVPLHWSRQISRGYNQADIIAGGVAAQLGVPLSVDILRRNRHTKSQARISREERASNLSGVFSADVNALAGVLEEGGVQHILLLDDVFTTGATLSEAQHTLRMALYAADKKRATKIRISVAALACVGE